jgi:hypothetical protein
MRILLMMSDARRASVTMSVASSSSRSGACRINQRKLASPLAAIAASGCFSSCAMEAVNSPSIETRAAWAKSAHTH